ncbi:MAG: hypothetical protein K5873_01530 [Treponema sp.]|nr:hypothetical protein [Treponema sp.]
MSEVEIIFFIIKLILGGIIAFLAIMLWSRTRDYAWMFLVLGAVTAYSSIVFDLLLKLGFIKSRQIILLGNDISLIQLLLLILPSLCTIIAFIIMLHRTGRK